MIKSKIVFILLILIVATSKNISAQGTLTLKDNSSVGFGYFIENLDREERQGVYIVGTGNRDFDIGFAAGVDNNAYAYSGSDDGVFISPNINYYINTQSNFAVHLSLAYNLFSKGRNGFVTSFGVFYQFKLGNSMISPRVSVAFARNGIKVYTPGIDIRVGKFFTIGLTYLNRNDGDKGSTISGGFLFGNRKTQKLTKTNNTGSS